MTNNDLQNTTQKTKDKATRTPIKKMRMNLGAPEGYNEGGTGQRHLTATETVQSWVGTDNLYNVIIFFLNLQNNSNLQGAQPSYISYSGPRPGIPYFFRNACTKSGSLRFSQFSGC